MKRHQLTIGLATLLVAATSLVPLSSCTQSGTEREASKTPEVAAQPKGQPDQVPVEKLAFDVPPEAITQVPPVYPEGAKKAGVSGRVLLEVLVNADGTVGSARAIEEVPDFPSFTESAIKAVMQWKFKPATKEGKPVPVTVAIPIHFALDKKEAS